MSSTMLTVTMVVPSWMLSTISLRIFLQMSYKLSRRGLAKATGTRITVSEKVWDDLPSQPLLLIEVRSQLFQPFWINFGEVAHVYILAVRTM